MTDERRQLLSEARQVIRDLRGVAFIGSHRVRESDPLLKRCVEIERRLTIFLAITYLTHNRS
jgi:hypothetical protein